MDNIASESITRGAARLPIDSELVADADEEVFLIYSDLQSTNHPESPSSGGHRGLGYVDSHKDTLDVRFELKPSHIVESELTILGRTGKNNKPTRKSRKVKEEAVKVVDITLYQDKTALRSRKGDTGSVLWKASIDFAQMILQQSYYPSGTSLFDERKLAGLHVLELGAGTGLLSIAFSPLVGSYTVTDIDALLPLIRKNVMLNTSGSPAKLNQDETPSSRICVEELDWLALHSTPVQLRPRLFKMASPADLLLCVDCIYHTYLLPALVDTIDHCSIANKTIVLVVVELRADDVIRSFLELWLAKPGWEIWRVGRSGSLGKPYVIWLGWKTE